MRGEGAGSGTQRRRPWRWRRRLAVAAAVVVLLPLLAAGAALFALRSAGARQALLARADRAAREATGVSVTAADFRLDPWRGVLDVERLAAAVPGAPPFLTADRLRVEVDLGSLRAPVLVVRAVAVDRPRLDLAAPLPRLPAGGGESGAPARRVDVLAVTARGGEVVNGIVPDAAAPYLAAWSLAGIDADAAWVGGRASATLTVATGEVVRAGGERRQVRLEIAGSGVPGGELALERLHLTAAGLDASATAAGTAAAEGPLTARMRVAAQPALLAPELALGGEVGLVVTARLPERTVEAHLEATGLAAAALRPYLGDALVERAGAAGTTVDVTADVAGPLAAPDRLAGSARLAWNAGGERRLDATLTLAPRPGEPRPVRVEVAADLLPDLPGTRHASAALAAATLTGAADGVIEAATVELDVPDIVAAYGALRARWPLLVPEVGGGAAATGAPGATGSFVAPADAGAPQDDSGLGTGGGAGADGKVLEDTGRAGALAGPGLASQHLRAGEGARAPAAATETPGATGVLHPPSRTAARPAWLTGAVRATVRASGAVAAPRVALDAAWTPEAGSAVTVTAAGEPLAQRGAATIAVERLRLGLLRPGVEGVVTATAHAAGSPASWRAKLTLDGERLRMAPDPPPRSGEDLRTAADATASGGEGPGSVPDSPTGDGEGLRTARNTAGVDGEGPRTEATTPALDALHIEAATDGARVHVTALSGALGEARFAGTAEAALALPLADARLDLHVARPVPQIDAADVSLRLVDGVLHVDVPGVDTAAGSAALAATVPLGALRALPQLADALAGAPLVVADGAVRIALDAPGLDSCALGALFDLPERSERLRGDVHADLLVDLADPTAAVGEVALANLVADLGDRTITTAAPVRLALADRRLRLPTVEIATADVAAYVEGEVTLARSFDPAGDPAALVEHVAVDLAGAVDTALLQPYLAGGVAAGELRFDASAEGKPSALAATFSLYGPDVSFFWPTPYATRLSALELDGELRDGVAVLRSGRAALNGGVLGLFGRRDGDGALAARVTLDDVRYRLDLGVSAVLAGDLRLELPPAGRGGLTGEVVLRRALLARDVDLDREVLRRFLSPVTTTGTETGLLDTIDLDVALSTVDGVKVKNNVADLVLSWEPLAIGGTAWNPTIRGRVDARPGGRVFAYGQTVCIDSGAFTFTGNPLSDPLIEMKTRSSLSDPSCTRLTAESSPAAAPAAAGGGGADVGDALTAGVAGYFGEALGSRLTEALGLGTISMRPLLIFGEADPGARLTLTRDLSRNVAFAFSLDLRNAQRQTYLLDLHSFRAAPSLSAQVFTTDEGEYGTTLQQSFELGGPPRGAAGASVVHRVRATPPPGVPRRALRAAIGVTKGDTLPDGAAFDIEVEVATLLRERGYPDAEVRVDVAPSPERPGRVDLAVAIDPGPRVEVVFAGEKIPSGSRALITPLYRTGYWEAAAIAEMRKTAVRVLRARGFLDPRVEITAAVRAPGAPPDAPDRTVTVACEGGRRLELAAPAFAGLPAEEAALVAARFPTAIERAELAAGMRDADARVLESLRVLGYPDGRVAARALDEATGVLTVTVAPGERTLLAAVAASGLTPADEARLLAGVPLAAGDPARADRIALAALAIEQDLRRRGFADATVRPRVAAVAGGAPAVRVTLEADPGAAYRVGAVSFDALRHTRRSLAARLAGLKEGAVYDPADVAAARARLAQLGVFASVAADARRRPDGAVDVTFRAEERPRFTLAYGVRWESEAGLGAVVDAVDRNLLGRAVTLGGRLRWESDDESARLYLGADDLLGSRAGFQTFAEWRRRTQGNLQYDTLESTFGLTHPAWTATMARAYAAYRDSRLTEVEPDPFFPLDVRLKHPYVGAQLVLDTRTDPLRGGAGWFASADLSGSGPWIGSDFEYARLFAQVNWYRPVRLAGLAATWAQSLRVGAAKPFSGQELIPDARFFAGGAYSVRGYDDESLGPTETLGDLVRAVGGEALLVLNEELRVPLPWDLTGLVFADVGNVWATPSDFGRDLAVALGLGVRADTPIGLLRLDAAFPLDAPAGAPGFKLYLGFGNAF